MRPLSLLLLLSATAVQAAPIDALKPMAFLAGHCWKGEFAAGKPQTDEHCFQWMYDGKALRDVHTARSPGKPDYVGETIYYYDATAKHVAYLYVGISGGHSRGTMTPTATGLDFPVTQHIDVDGEVFTYRSKWAPTGSDAYDVLSETQRDGKWVTQFKMRLTKQ
ncbi:hypothetical protein NHH82_29425 [Oxalobacteraceae bacterium OTU3REALA1]|nr:hypothetical protein NHH82_29425 [Oxalobacteraceae bacterium OTU3REALA1]